MAQTQQKISWKGMSEYIFSLASQQHWCMIWSGTGKVNYISSFLINNEQWWICFWSDWPWMHFEFSVLYYIFDMIQTRGHILLSPQSCLFRKIPFIRTYGWSLLYVLYEVVSPQLHSCWLLLLKQEWREILFFNSKSLKSKLWARLPPAGK